jgi:prepilin-type N-terminal cleavage/methylation domain-containing protein
VILEKQKGLTLIEVLLAWAMMAIFLSGAMVEQAEFLRKSRLENDKRLAQWQIESMAERLFANKTPAARARELSIWEAQNKRLLPHAQGQLRCSEIHCNIQLNWRGGRQLELRI